MEFIISAYDKAIQRGITREEKGKYAREVSPHPKQYKFTIDSFSEWVGAGKGFTSSIFKDGERRINKNAQGSNIIALDFDQKSESENAQELTIENVVEYLTKLEATPNIVYKSTSFTPEVQKFRVIWFFDETIPPSELTAILTLLTNKTFSKHSPFMTDKACKDAARFFLGGFDSTVYNEKPFSYLPFKEIMVNEYAFQGGGSEKVIGRRKSRVLDNYSKLTKSGYSIYNTNRIHEKRQLSDSPEMVEHIERVKTTLGNPFNYALAKELSPRFKDFCNGEGQRLTYDEQYNLSLTLFKYKGGLDFMREKLNLWNENVLSGKGNLSERRVYDEGRQRPFICRNEITYQYEYSREPLTEWWDEYAPENLRRLSDLGRESIKGIVVHTPVRTIPLEVGQDMLKTAMQAATDRTSEAFEYIVDRLNEQNRSTPVEKKRMREMVWTLRADTGLGKTENYLGLKGVVIAVPTHKLKEEVVQRMEKAGNEVYSIPETPTFQTPFFNQEIKRLKRRKSYTKVSDFIKDIAARKITPSKGAIECLRTLDARTAKDYLNAKMTALNAPENATIVTTHLAAIKIGNGFKQKKVIFDENPRSALFNVQSFTQRDVSELLGEFNEQVSLFETQKRPPAFIHDLKTLSRVLSRQTTYGNAARDSERLVFKRKNLLYEELSKHDCGEAIINFIEADVWQAYENNRGQFEFRGVERLSLPTEKEVTILSATIEDWELWSLGYRQAYVDIPKITNEGKVIQDTTLSTSRQALSDPKKLQALAEKTKDADVHLTYKAFADKFENASDRAYVGNSAGYNEFKGARIALSGENRPNPIEIELWMKLFNFTPEEGWDNFSMKTLKDKNFEYPAYSSPDENVNRIIKMFIQEDKTQRIGRSRVIREDKAQVDIYGRTPSPYADEIIDRTGTTHYPRQEE